MGAKLEFQAWVWLLNQGQTFNFGFEESVSLGFKLGLGFDIMVSNHN